MLVFSFLFNKNDTRIIFNKSNASHLETQANISTQVMINDKYITTESPNQITIKRNTNSNIINKLYRDFEYFNTETKRDRLFNIFSP